MKQPAFVLAAVGLSLGIGLWLGLLNRTISDSSLDLSSREGYLQPDCDRLKPSQRTAQACTFFVRSHVLDEDVPIRVIVPPGFPSAGSYSTVYFLHDQDGSMLADRASMAEDLDFPQLMTNQKVNWIVVAPQDRRGSDHWMNGAKNGRKWNDFLMWELPDEIEVRFKARSKPCDRLVVGVGMGAYGALYHVFQYPQQYAGIAAHSPLFRVGKEDVLLDNKDLLVFGMSASELNRRLLPKIYREDHVSLNRPVYISAGENDEKARSKYKGTAEFIEKIRQREPSSTIQIHEGLEATHSPAHWRLAIETAIPWYTKTLKDSCRSSDH